MEIKAVDKEVPEKWRTIAEKEGLNVAAKLVYGDKLYEQVFA